MKTRAIITIFSMLFASVSYAGSEKTPEQAKNSQIIYRPESQKSFKGPEDLFAGDVQKEKVTDEQYLVYNFSFPSSVSTANALER